MDEILLRLDEREHCAECGALLLDQQSCPHCGAEREAEEAEIIPFLAANENALERTA